MGFHLIKVCTDNCYYLIFTIWEEPVFIRGFDWDVEGRETNVCFVVLYKSLLSGGLCICRDGGLFCVSETLMRSLFQHQSHVCVWENIHVCPILQAHQLSQGKKKKHNTLHWRCELTVESPLLWVVIYILTIVCMVSSLRCVVLFLKGFEKKCYKGKNIKTWQKPGPSLCLFFTTLELQNKASVFSDDKAFLKLIQSGPVYNNNTTSTFQLFCIFIHWNVFTFAANRVFFIDKRILALQYDCNILQNHNLMLWEHSCKNKTKASLN